MNVSSSFYIMQPCDRMAIVYNTEASLFEGDEEMTELPEEFFDVTVKDVRKMYVDLKNQRFVLCFVDCRYVY